MCRSLLLQYGKAASFATLALAFVPLTGCRQDMHDQPKFFPQRGTTLFADGRSVRPQVPGTVARSQAVTPSYFTTGLIEGGAEGDGLPFAATRDVLLRGQERYNVYCTPCHSRVGNGKGMAVERGYYGATTFHSYRLRNAPLGHFFSVITNGYGAMPDYAAQITPADRWAIVAYIRALQLSQNAAATDVPAGKKVETLASLEANEGFPGSFLDEWLKPATAPYTIPATSSPAKTTPDAAVVAPPAAPVAAPVPVAKPTTAAAVAPAPKALTPAAAAAPVAEPSAPAAAGATEPTKGGHGNPLMGALRAMHLAPAAKGDAAHGKEIYAANCSMCHQPTRAGMPPVFPSLIGVVDRVGEKRVRTVARTGIPEAKPPMPPHPNLTDKDIDDLLAFLKTKP